MQNTAMQIELDDHDTPSIWPWVIGAMALVLLFASVRSNLNQIPRTLSRQALTTALALNASDIDIAVDGRDLALSGTLNADIDRDGLVNQVAAIPGVRIVVDDMQVYDPREQARFELLGFKEGLETINISQVAFERGSASLTANSRDTLLQLVQVLKTYPQFRIRVSGHTDNTGRAEVNLRISRQRASAVAEYLVDNNVNPNQVVAQGYGATRPIADNSTEAGRAANRRIEINHVN